jgi:hypothetical protein
MPFTEGRAAPWSAFISVGQCRSSKSKEDGDSSDHAIGAIDRKMRLRARALLRASKLSEQQKKELILLYCDQERL